ERPMQKLPTAEEAIAQFRAGMRAQRMRERGGAAVGRTRDTFVRDRENIARSTIKDAIKKRFGTEKRFLDLIDRPTSTPPRPPRRPMNINPNLDRSRAAGRRAYDAVTQWQQATQRWLTEMEAHARESAQLKTFLEQAINRVRNEIDDYKKRNNIIRA